MRRRLSAVAAALSLAGAALAAVGGLSRAQAQVRPTARACEGRIKDVRPALGFLILTVGAGEEARDVRFDITEGRVVGPSGSELKGEDLRVGDRVRVEMAIDRPLVQQVVVLGD